MLTALGTAALFILKTKADLIERIGRALYGYLFG